MIGAKHQRNVEILPPLSSTAVHKPLLTVDAATAPAALKNEPIRSPKNIGANQSPGKFTVKPNTSHSPTKKNYKEKGAPLARPIVVDKNSDRDIIDGIRSDLRATFSLLGGHHGSHAAARGASVGDGHDDGAVPGVMVDVAQQRLAEVSLGGTGSGAGLLNSASAPDVGQIRQGGGEFGMHDMHVLDVGQGESDHLHTGTPLPDRTEVDNDVAITAMDVMATYQHAEEAHQRRASTRMFPLRNKRAGTKQSQSRRAYSQPLPTTLPFSNPNDYTLPPVRHGIASRSSRQHAPHTSHGLYRAKRSPFSPALSTQSRQDSQQARLEEQRNQKQEYVSIVGKVSFGQKTLTSEKRSGLLWVPCERCQHKGGRCSSCTVIRVGGGYIVLEAGELTERQQRYLRHHHKELTSESGELKIQSRPGTGFRSGWKIAADSDKEEDDLNGRASSRRSAMDEVIDEDDDDGGDGGSGGDDGDGVGGGGGERLRSARVAASRQKSAVQNGSAGDDTPRATSQSSRQNRPPSARRSTADGRGARVPSARGSGRSSRLSDNREEESDDDSGNTSTGIRADGGDGDNKDDGSGKGTSVERPPSAKQGGRNPRTLRQRHKLDVDGGGGFNSARGGRQNKSPGGDGGGGAGTGNLLDPGNRSSSPMQSRLKSAPPTPRAEDEVRRRKKKQTSATLEESDEDFEEDGEFDPATRHKLRKFKYERKKDTMGVKECDWKELKGIDPLDYLAKYCIVDQERIPTYERIYHNVDLDEDDEISLDQLDFALKAVNNQLISDPEMEFVFHVLELAQRPKLNFKLYCLVAALSERVVMLDDMVKKLVNKMDFEALEVKMKKVKELFYLLADMEHRGGVVTTGNLAIELTAGGLTPDHVKLVTNHLSREKKGLVEFLDYLTYVPLFMEIHGSIVSNPLDLSRDR